MNEVIVQRDKLNRNLSLEQQKVAIQGQQVIDAREAQRRLRSNYLSFMKNLIQQLGNYVKQMQCIKIRLSN